MIPKTIIVLVMLASAKVGCAQTVVVPAPSILLDPPSVTWVPPVQFPATTYTYTQYPYTLPYTGLPNSGVWVGGYGAPYGSIYPYSYAAPYGGFGRYRELHKVKIR